MISQVKPIFNRSRGRGKQGGIALVTLVIFVVVLLSLLTAMVAMSRATSQSTGEQTVKLLASAVLDQSNMLKSGFDLKSSLGTSLTEISFSDEPNHGLFDPVKPYASRQMPPGDALLNNRQTARWLYANPYRASDAATTVGIGLGKGLKTQSGTVPALLLFGVIDSVCKKINETTRNFSATAAIPSASSISEPRVASTSSADAGLADEFDLSIVSYTGVKYRDDKTDVEAVGLGDASAGCFSIGQGTGQVNVFVNVVK
jgi:hypothetical protein